MDGHSGDVYCLAAHPCKPHVVATVSDSGHVHVWDTAVRQMSHCAALGWAPRALAFSVAPVASTGTHHIAVGGAKGHIKVWVWEEEARGVNG
jgi:WD40 repeat protein